jgi:hypothetical protein
MRQITKGLLVTTLCAASGLAGFFIAGRLEQTAVFPTSAVTNSAVVNSGSKLACTASGAAIIYKHPFKEQFEGSLSWGSDKLSIKIADDGKSLKVLTAAAVEIGATDAGNPIPIIQATQDYIVATVADRDVVDTLFIDRKGWRAIWSSTKVLVLGAIVGQTLAFKCV